MRYVLDASVMIAFLRGEPGANVVAQALQQSESDCYAHSLNLCEVYYDFYRAAGPERAAQAIADLASVGVAEDAVLTAKVWQSAGCLKATLRRVSLADCFAIDLAQRLNAILLTADHHEFDALIGQVACQIRFIR